MPPSSSIDVRALRSAKPDALHPDISRVELKSFAFGQKLGSRGTALGIGDQKRAFNVLPRYRDLRQMLGEMQRERPPTSRVVAAVACLPNHVRLLAFQLAFAELYDCIRQAAARWQIEAI